MKHFANSWDSVALFCVPKIVSCACFLSISFVPESWTTPMVVVGFIALAFELVLDILRYRHSDTKEAEDGDICDGECMEQEMNENNAEKEVKQNRDTQKEPESKWDRIGKWYDAIDEFEEYGWIVSIVVTGIFLFCAKCIAAWLK